ncbi:MAG: rane protein [Streptosporangiaceae bacterium]|nr:rane protein [Streptosporangiaceae bacterium]
MLAVTLLAAVLVGVSLGALGGGGSMLTVPLLVYGAGRSPSDAIAMSLVIVSITSAVATVSHARAGRVHWHTAAVFGTGGMAGAYGGGRLASLISGSLLLLAFAVLMMVTAVAMIRGGPADAVLPPSLGPMAPRLSRITLHGLGVGIITGLLGAGGGFLIVPALTLLAGLPMAAAVGTSLAVIAMNSAVGLAGHLATADLDWPLTLAFAAAAVAGTLAGRRLTGLVPDHTLRRIFGWFVVLMGVVVLAEQLHRR